MTTGRTDYMSLRTTWMKRNPSDMLINPRNGCRLCPLCLGKGTELCIMCRGRGLVETKSKVEK